MGKIRISLRSKRRDTNPLGNQYYTMADVDDLPSLAKVDILCDDEKHYHADCHINRDNQTVRITFPHWNKKWNISDGLELLDDIYIAPRGHFSSADGITSRNCYPGAHALYSSKKKKPKVTVPVVAPKDQNTDTPKRNTKTYTPEEIGRPYVKRPRLSRIEVSTICPNKEEASGSYDSSSCKSDYKGGNSSSSNSSDTTDTERGGAFADGLRGVAVTSEYPPLGVSTDDDMFSTVDHVLSPGDHILCMQEEDRSPTSPLFVPLEPFQPVTSTRSGEGGYGSCGSSTSDVEGVGGVMSETGQSVEDGTWKFVTAVLDEALVAICHNKWRTRMEAVNAELLLLQHQLQSLQQDTVRVQQQLDACHEHHQLAEHTATGCRLRVDVCQGEVTRAMESKLLLLAPPTDSSTSGSNSSASGNQLLDSAIQTLAQLITVRTNALAPLKQDLVEAQQVCAVRRKEVAAAEQTLRDSQKELRKLEVSLERKMETRNKMLDSVTQAVMKWLEHPCKGRLYSSIRKCIANMLCPEVMLS